jgi:hypothetical protein
MSEDQRVIVSLMNFEITISNSNRKRIGRYLEAQVKMEQPEQRSLYSLQAHL